MCCRRCGSATPGAGDAAARATRRAAEIRESARRARHRASTRRSGRFALDVGTGARRRARRRCSSPRTRPTRERLFGTPERVAVREGRVPRATSSSGRAGRGEPGARRHQGRRAAIGSRSPARGEREAAACACRRGAPSAAREPLGRELRRGVRGRAVREADAFYDALMPAGMRRGRAPRRAAGLRRAALDEAVLPLRRRATGSRATRRSRRRRPSAQRGRNAELAAPAHARRLSMPDKWEYPWFAAWDLAFHMIPFAQVDPDFAKQQLLLLLREWYMHPNGQLPAYEWAFGDVNPPVHAWAAWRVYKIDGAGRQRDRAVPRARLPEAAAQLHLVGEPQGRRGQQPLRRRLPRARQHRRLRPLAAAADRRPPRAGRRHRVDGVLLPTMLSMALELAQRGSRLRRHGVQVLRALRRHRRRHEHLGGDGLWDEEDGFYYDQLHVDGGSFRCGCARWSGSSRCSRWRCSRRSVSTSCRSSRKRMKWFLEQPPRPRAATSRYRDAGGRRHEHRLLAIPSRERLRPRAALRARRDRVPSPYGVRSLSRVHKAIALRVQRRRRRSTASTTRPASRDTGLFGGNSNWRGPVWFPLNYLLIEALERYHHFYGDALQVECPTGSGR